MVEAEWFRNASDGEIDAALQAVFVGGYKRGCNCEACYQGTKHMSDCSVHNEPAYPNGPCDCV